MENLARHIIRAPFSQEGMNYIQEESKVVYQGKDGNEQKVFDALEWPALLNNRQLHFPSFRSQPLRLSNLMYVVE